MRDTNDHPEDAAPPDPETGASEDFTTGALADTLRPALPVETTRAIAKAMNSAISSWGLDYVPSIPKFDPSPIMSEISASIQSKMAAISAAVFDLGERSRHVDMTKLYQFEMPKIFELDGMTGFSKSPVLDEISEAARRFTARIPPYTAGFGSYTATAPLGIGLPEMASGLQLELPAMGPSIRDSVLSGIGGAALFGGRDPEQNLGLVTASLLPADLPLLNRQPGGGSYDVLGLQLAQYMPTGTVFEAMRRWMPHESITESLRAWWPLAGRGLPAAQIALGEALGVVSALQRNDTRAPEMVQQFLITWLRFREVSIDLVSSAVLVLLDTGRWLPAELHNFDPRKKLRSRILIEHRQATRLSTDPGLRFGGQPLRSLQEPIGDDEQASAVLTLGDRVADPRAVDPAEQLPDEFSHPWMRELCWKLTTRERTILRAKSQPRVTWAEAAVECGGTIAEGEALRRKIKRLSKLDLAGQRPGRAVS